MDIVKDEEDEEDDEDDSEDEGKEGFKRTPVKLRGRGGFGHPRGAGRSRGRGNGRGRGGSTAQASTASQAPEASAVKADPMDGLASSMSALQFVPHSIYSRGKARGRGAG